MTAPSCADLGADHIWEEDHVNGGFICGGCGYNPDFDSPPEDDEED